ncbi:JAB domain-containing protein [Tenacibaculum sp.]
MDHQLNQISAPSIKLVHNHPAGEPTLSKEDIRSEDCRSSSNA